MCDNKFAEIYCLHLSYTKCWSSVSSGSGISSLLVLKVESSSLLKLPPTKPLPPQNMIINIHIGCIKKDNQREQSERTSPNACISWYCSKLFFIMRNISFFCILQLFKNKAGALCWCWLNIVLNFATRSCNSFHLAPNGKGKSGSV